MKKKKIVSFSVLNSYFRLPPPEAGLPTWVITPLREVCQQDTGVLAKGFTVGCVGSIRAALHIVKQG